MVGRELLTMCPDGEDHQGHDWGGTEMVYLGNTSRGMIKDFRRLIPLMKLIFYNGLLRIVATAMMRTAAFIPISFYLMVWRLVINSLIQGVLLLNTIMD